MMERDQMNDSQELPAQVQRAAALIREEVDVRWPAGHVEIALIQLQRRRHQRRTAALGMTLSVAGVALVLALGFRGYLRDELGSRAPSASPPPANLVVDSLAAGLP